MKSLTFLLFAVALALPLHAQEILKNSDFSDGATYWHGDAKPAGTEDATDLISDAAASAKGIVVELHSGGWTKVTQEIRGYKSPVHDGQIGAHLMLTIVYQTSPDFNLSTHASDYVNVGSQLGFGGADLRPHPGELVAFIDDAPEVRVSVTPMGGVNNYAVHLDNVAGTSFIPATEAKPQTFTSKFFLAIVNPDIFPTFCLGLPPGSGTITILKISVTPASSDSGAAQAP